MIKSRRDRDEHLTQNASLQVRLVDCGTKRDEGLAAIRKQQDGSEGHIRQREAELVKGVDRAIQDKQQLIRESEAEIIGMLSRCARDLTASQLLLVWSSCCEFLPFSLF